MIILFVSLLLFKITFSTAIYGDEWQIFWLGKAAIHTKGSILHQDPYNVSLLFEIISFHSLARLFGYNGTVFYLLSYICRLIAAYFVFWFLNRRQLSKGASFLGSLLFMLSPVGIETTDWVRNFDSYVALSLFLFILNNILEFKSLKDSYKIPLLMFLVVLINPIRSPGVVITIIGILLIKIITSINTRRTSIIILITCIFLYLLMSFVGILGAQPSNLFAQFNIPDFLYSIFGNIGNIIVPNGRYQIILFILISLNLLVIKGVYKMKSVVNIIYFLFNIFYIISILLLTYLGYTKFKISFHIGLYFSLLFFFHFCWNFYKKDYKNLFLSILLFLLSFSFIVIPLIRIPQIRADSEHRYFIYSALLTPFIIAYATEVILHLKNNLLIKTVYFSSLVLVFVCFATLSYSYLSLQNWAHNKKYSESIWLKIIDQIDPSEVHGNSFVVLTNPGSYPMVNSTVYFGSNFHLGLLYGIWDTKKLPEVWISQNVEFDKLNLPENLFLNGKRPIIFRILNNNVDRINPTAKP